jgi:hypothetical protein
VKRGFGPAKWLRNGLQILAAGRSSRKQPQTVRLRHKQQIKWEIPDEMSRSCRVAPRAHSGR